MSDAKPVKTYVPVQVIFDTNGNMKPSALAWEDGTVFEIDRVLANFGGIVSEVELQQAQKIKAAQALFNDTFINGTGGYNLAFPDGILTWMQSSYTSSLGSIDSISMSTPTLTVSEGQANFWGGVLIFIVPLACVAAAVAIVVVRRRR